MKKAQTYEELELFISENGLNFNDSIEYLIKKLEEEKGLKNEISVSWTNALYSMHGNEESNLGSH